MEAPDVIDPWDRPFRVVLNLDDEESVEVGSFPDETGAETYAHDLIVRLAQRGEWPRAGRRFVNPDRIVSVEICERKKWAGSESRARWASQSLPEPQAEEQARAGAESGPSL